MLITERCDRLKANQYTSQIIAWLHCGYPIKHKPLWHILLYNYQRMTLNIHTGTSLGNPLYKNPYIAIDSVHNNLPYKYQSIHHSIPFRFGSRGLVRGMGLGLVR